MKKKIISLTIVLMLIILPFGIIFNVKAEGTEITTTTNNLVNNDVTLTINNVAPNDNFQAYKIVDIFYDREHNAMTYAFTTEFQSFINNSQNQLVSSLTIDKYITLSDDTRTSTIDGINQPNVKEIMTEYAIYLDSNNISGTPLNKTNNTISHTLKAGAYLVLPTSNSSYSQSLYGGIGLRLKTYKTLLVNATFTVNESNEWILNPQEVSLKYLDTGFEYGINDISTTEIKNIIDTTSSYAAVVQHTMANYQLNNSQTYSISIYNDGRIDNYNNSAVYGNEAILNKLKTFEVDMPQGIDYDLDSIYRITGNISNVGLAKSTLENGIIKEGNDSEQIGTYSISNRKIKFNINYINSAIIMNISLNNNAVLASTGNPINLTAYRIKDLYATIDSTITEEDIDNAFIYAETASDNATYQQIRKVLEKVETSAVVYTYGVEITNVEQDTNNSLSGAEFGVFTYDTTNDTCTNTQIGSNFSVTNNTANFVGVDGLNKFCVKQVKAPSGYKLNTTPAIIGPDTANNTINQDGNYALTITNAKMSVLPFTGGVGTILYTGLGLLIIVGSTMFIIVYKKKNKKEIIEEL